MPTAKDGSKHASHSRAKFHDEREEEKKKSAKPAGEKAGEASGDRKPHEQKEPKPGNHAEPDGDEGMDSQEPIEDVVAMHGPADKIEMDKEPASGAMKVTSHHGGMKHHSTHADPMGAAHHMMKAMGHQPPPNAPAPAAGGMGGDATGMGMGSGIPGMM